MKLLAQYDDETFNRLKRDGKKNKLIVYKRCGVALARKLPDRVNRNRNTIDASHTFGLAASRGKTFRELLSPLFHFPKSRMHLRFATHLKQCLLINEEGTLSMKIGKGLQQFPFNEVAELRRHWQVQLYCQQQPNNIEIIIPAFVPTLSFKAPRGTTSIECKIAVACVRMSDGEANGDHHTCIKVPYDDLIQPPRSLSLPIATSEGCLIIVGAALTYLLDNNKRETGTKFLPSSVIDAWFIETKAQGTWHKAQESPIIE
jgi:hypothetical protein